MGGMAGGSAGLSPRIFVPMRIPAHAAHLLGVVNHGRAGRRGGMMSRSAADSERISAMAWSWLGNVL
jgi:hypothetical protein